MPGRKPVGRNAIIEAIKECDELKRDNFLQQYKWGKARNYFLIYKDQEYDSKAILTVAHKYEYPDEAPLRYEDNLYRGKHDAARLLRELGFCIEYRSSAGCVHRFC